MASKSDGTWWQKIQQHPFITAGIIFVLLILAAFAFAVSKYGWDWTGINGGFHKISTAIDIKSSPKKITKTEELQPAKTFWDFLLLLAAVAIPVVVGFGAAFFTAQHGRISERENKDNQRETALQAYIDKMSELLLDKDHPLCESEPEDEVRIIARVRTIAILFQLDARRIGCVFAFLCETGLMSATQNDSAVSLKNADLRRVKWSGANLIQADLREAFLFGADLSGANLSNANLRKAGLSGANLSGADLSSANLSEALLSKAFLFGTYLIQANLRDADLRGAFLFGANLSNADLRGANLRDADLRGANLRETFLFGANLSNADLRGANLKNAIGVTTEELEKQAKSLEGAIMPTLQQQMKQDHVTLQQQKREVVHKGLEEHMSILLQHTDSNLSKFFGRYRGDGLDNFKLVLSENTIKFGNEQDYKYYYMLSMRRYPQATFRATTRLSSHYLWKDETFLDANKEFIDKGGHIQRIFFLEKDQVDSSKVRDILTKQFLSRIEVYIAINVPPKDQALFVVDDKAEIAWEVRLNDAKIFESAIVTTNEQRTKHYLSCFNDLLNNSQRYSPGEQLVA